MNDRDRSADGASSGGSPDDDALWRSIVDNYGDRASLSAEELAALAPAEPDRPTPRDDPLERFLPPDPPPLPRPEPPALIAWAGVLLAPLLLIVLFMFLPGVFPTFLGVLLTVWFLGGFAYLVSAMPSEPPDPGDDGARL